MKKNMCTSMINFTKFYQPNYTPFHRRWSGLFKNKSARLLKRKIPSPRKIIAISDPIHGILYVFYFHGIEWIEDRTKNKGKPFPSIFAFASKTIDGSSLTTSCEMERSFLLSHPFFSFLFEASIIINC